MVRIELRVDGETVDRSFALAIDRVLRASRQAFCRQKALPSAGISPSIVIQLGVPGLPIHLSEDMIARGIDNILRSDIKYLLTTTYPEGENRAIHSGNWFTLNLCAPPYNFPPPVRVLEDWVPPFDRRQLALWEIDSLRRARMIAASHR